MDAALGACPKTRVRSGLAQMRAPQGRRRRRYSERDGASADATGRAGEPHPGVLEFPGQPLPSITLACALRVEEKAARRGGARTARVGLGASLPLPDGRLAGFGLAGALVAGLPPGTLLTAERVVDETGATLWEGMPLAVDGATPAVLCAARCVVDDPADRAALARRTGAVAVEMESGPLAASGRLAGVVRAVADSPDRPVGILARASTQDGRTAWGWVGLAFLLQPARSYRASKDARQALGALTQAARSLGET